MMKKIIKLGVSGAYGRMGSRIISLALQDKDFDVVVALEREDHPEFGKKISGINVVSSPESIKEVDGLIEFTAPQSSMEHLAVALKYKKALVLGTTGFNSDEQKKILSAAKKIPIVFSPNMSLGVNTLFHLLREAVLRLPQDYKASIKEAHHIHKKDAPSGTAKFLAQIIKDEGGNLNEDILSIREGEIIGDHEIIFESPWDTIKLSHSAKTRDILVLGALAAMKFVAEKSKGLYNMADVLKSIRKH